MSFEFSSVLLSEDNSKWYNHFIQSVQNDTSSRNDSESSSLVEKFMSTNFDVEIFIKSMDGNSLERRDESACSSKEENKSENASLPYFRSLSADAENPEDSRHEATQGSDILPLVSRDAVYMSLVSSLDTDETESPGSIIGSSLESFHRAHDSRPHTLSSNRLHNRHVSSLLVLSSFSLFCFIA